MIAGHRCSCRQTRIPRAEATRRHTARTAGRQLPGTSAPHEPTNCSDKETTPGSEEATTVPVSCQCRIMLEVMMCSPPRIGSMTIMTFVLFSNVVDLIYYCIFITFRTITFSCNLLWKKYKSSWLIRITNSISSRPEMVLWTLWVRDGS